MVGHVVIKELFSIRSNKDDLQILRGKIYSPRAESDCQIRSFITVAHPSMKGVQSLQTDF